MSMSKVEFSEGIEVVTTGFIYEDNKLLLARSDKLPNIWVLPGGHINPREKIFDSCEREIEEELGLKVKAIEIFNSGESIGNSHFIYFDILLELKRDEIGEPKEEDLLEYDWFTIEQALKLDIPDFFKKEIPIFKRYLESV